MNILTLPKPQDSSMLIIYWCIFALPTIASLYFLIIAYLPYGLGKCKLRILLVRWLLEILFIALIILHSKVSWNMSFNVPITESCILVLIGIPSMHLSFIFTFSGDSDLPELLNHIPTFVITIYIIIFDGVYALNYF